MDTLNIVALTEFVVADYFRSASVRSAYSYPNLSYPIIFGVRLFAVLTLSRKVLLERVFWYHPHILTSAV